MVLFREDEARIRAQERAEKLARRSKLEVWCRRFFKIAIMAALVIWVGLWLLMALSGNHAALKKGIEDYLIQATGLQAGIGEFNYMGFFPDLALDAGDIAFHSGEEAGVLVKIGHVKFAAGFFDVMFSRRRLKDLEVKNIMVAAERAGGRLLKIDKMALAMDTGEGKPGFVMAGSWGEYEASARFDLALDGANRFILPEQGDFRFALGDLSVQGKAAGLGRWGETAIDLVHLGSSQHYLAGSVSIDKRAISHLVRLDLAFAETGRVTGELEVRGHNVTGNVFFPAVDSAAVKMLTGLGEELVAYWPQESRPVWAGWTYDIAVRVGDSAPVQLKSITGEAGNFFNPFVCHVAAVTAAARPGFCSDRTENAE